MTIGRGGMAVAALALAAFCFGTTETLPIGLRCSSRRSPPSGLGALHRRATRRSLASLRLALRLAARSGSRKLEPGFARDRNGYGRWWHEICAGGRDRLATPHPGTRRLLPQPPRSRGRTAACEPTGGALAIVRGVSFVARLGPAAGRRAFVAALGVMALICFAAITAILPGDSTGGLYHITAASPHAPGFRTPVVTITAVVGGVCTAHIYVADVLTRVKDIPGSTLSSLLLMSGKAEPAMADLVADRGLLAQHAVPTVVPALALPAPCPAAARSYVMFRRVAVVAPVNLVTVTDRRRRDRVRSQVRACENLIAQRAARRAGAMPAIAALLDDGGPPGPKEESDAMSTRGTALAGAMAAGAAVAVIGLERPSRARAPTGAGTASIVRTLHPFEDDGTVRGQDH
ncbi:putative arabinose transporter [Actinomadura madurae]|nr:putative arabinose transporter [Actinomadura madurae]